MKTLLALLFVALLGGAASAFTPTQTVTITGTFQDNSHDEDGFWVYRCATPNCIPNQPVGSTLPANTTTFTDTIRGDPGNVTYTYGVSSFHLGGESVKTIGSITTGPVPYTPPPPSACRPRWSWRCRR